MRVATAPRRRPDPTRRGAAAALAVLLSLTGCAGPPAGLTDGAIDYVWRFAFADLDEAILSVCGTSSQAIAVGGRGGRGLILEWSDGSWREAPLPPDAATLWWCAASPSGELWAVGERATVLRRASSGWIEVSTAAVIPAETTLYGVHAASDAVVVVGGTLNTPAGAPLIARYQGDRWTADTLPDATANPLFKIWGAADGAMWAVGAAGAALHHRDGGWQRVETGTSARLIAVHGLDADRVYAVGGDGVGLVLAWTGSRFAEIAQTPEALSGVFATAGELTVGGNRGYLAAFTLASDGSVVVPARAQTIAAADLCVHAVAEGGGAQLAAAADLFGGGSASWRGSVLFRGAPLVGAVTRLPTPDAGVVDAGSADAGVPDDAAPVDASALPGRGEPCLIAFPACAPGLECWLLQASNSYLCTEPCATAAECTGYGEACCARPGVQTLETVCLPITAQECQSPL